MLLWIRKGKLRWFWMVLLVCLPALWLSPITTSFPNVRIGYFVWTTSVTLIALSLGLITHQAEPQKINRRRVAAGCIIVLALTYILTHPHCVFPRFWQLQFLGRLPENVKYPDDMLIAEETYWWGRSLNPVQFWSNKVVWHDRVAEAEACRYGRSYPPIPYCDPSVMDRSDRATHGDGYDLSGGPVIHYLSSGRESAFWDKFSRTHPLPPEEIEYQQRQVADHMMHDRHTLATDTDFANRLRFTETSIKDRIAWQANSGKELGYPLECYDENALFWSYVLNKRQEYAEMLASDGYKMCERIANGQYDVNILSSNFFRNVYVDRKQITEPLSADDIKAANAWKVSYLSRLRQEKADESYINAYMQAWNLSSNDVFGIAE